MIPRTGESAKPPPLAETLLPDLRGLARTALRRRSVVVTFDSSGSCVDFSQGLRKDRIRRPSD